MKMKTFVQILLAAFFCTALPAFAESVTVTVKGMVCSFCAQGIKKTVGKLPDVSKVEVDLDKKVVELELKDPNTLSDKEIESTIQDAGYDVVKIERAKDA